MPFRAPTRIVNPNRQQLEPHTVDTFKTAIPPQSFIGPRPKRWTHPPSPTAQGLKTPPEVPAPKMCQRKGCTARATADVNGEQLCPWHSLGYVMDAPRPAAPAKPYKFDGPIKTTRPCAVCRDRLAWFDGNTCGPCAGTDRPTEIVLGGTESGVDASDLFPG